MCNTAGIDVRPFGDRRPGTPDPSHSCSDISKLAVTVIITGHCGGAGQLYAQRRTADDSMDKNRQAKAWVLPGRA
jgi:hypothetical protein